MGPGTQHLDPGIQNLGSETQNFGPSIFGKSMLMENSILVQKSNFGSNMASPGQMAMLRRTAPQFTAKWWVGQLQGSILESIREKMDWRHGLCVPSVFRVPSVFLAL